MQSAAQDHISRARQLEEKDQLDAALLEYRKAIEMDGTNRLAASRAATLERTIRERIEASRPRPRIETLREQARQGPPPLIGLRERLRGLNFTNSSVRDILNFIGSSAGINITYDQAFQDKAYSIELEDVTVEEALQQIMSANQLFYKVVNPKTIIVINDRADKRQQYDEMVVRVFYISHADAQELSQLVTTVDARAADAGRAGDHGEQDRQHHHRPRHVADRRHHRADHPLQRQAARRSRHRRADPGGEPRAREAVRPEPQRLRARVHVLAGGGAAEHQRATDRRRRPRRRRSTSTPSARASARPTST